MKRKILVTGAGGFIGRHLIRHLAKNERYDILAVTRGTIPLEHPRIQWIASPLERLESSLIAESDIVFHLASFTPKSSADANDIEKNIEQNLLATQRLLKSKYKKIIFTSTLDVYGATPALPIQESTPALPDNLYGLSKLFAERMLAVHAQSTGTAVSILRLSHVYGPGEEKYRKFIPVLLENTLRGQTTTVSGDGHATRDFIYVEDVCRIMERFMDIDYSFPVNICTGKSHSLNAVISIVRQLSNGQCAVSYTDGPPGRSIEFDNRLLRSLLGEDFAFTPLETGLACEYEHMKKLMADEK